MCTTNGTNSFAKLTSVFSKKYKSSKEVYKAMSLEVRLYFICCNEIVVLPEPLAPFIAISLLDQSIFSNKYLF